MPCEKPHYKLIVVIMIAYNPNLQVIVTLAWLLCSQHSFRLLLRVSEIHRMNSDDERLNLLSVVTWLRAFSPSTTWNLHNAQRWSNSVLTFDRSGLHSLSLRASSPFDMASEAIRGRTSELEHSRLHSRAPLAWLLATFPNGEFARRPALPSNLWLVLVRVESVDPIEQDPEDYSIELSGQRLEAKFHLLASSQKQIFHSVLFRKARRERITRYWYLHHYCNLRETVTISILQGLRPSLGVTGYALSKSLILRCVLVSLSSAMKFTGLIGAPSVDIDINVTSRVESGEISNPLGFPLSGLRRTVRPTSFVTHREA